MAQNGDDWQAPPRSAAQERERFRQLSATEQQRAEAEREPFLNRYTQDNAAAKPAPLTPEQIRERAEFLRQQDDQINAKAIGEGWGRAAFDMGHEPKDLEPQARNALRHAREDIVALHKALLTVASKVDDGLEVLPPMQLAAVNRIVGKYRL